MKIDRRYFIGSSILAAIPSFDAIGSVFQKQEPSIRRGLAVVSCQKLHDPEINVSNWSLPTYKIDIEISESGFEDKWRLICPSIGKIIKNRILFMDREGKEVEIRESENTRILFYRMEGNYGESKNGVFSESYCFHEVPAVIFNENRVTSEEVWGVSVFPSVSQ